MPDNLVLKLTQIQKQLPSGFYLNKVDLELESGEIHVVMGENGSGKSALMQIVSGLLQPDNGTIEVLGEQVSFSNMADAAEKSVIYIQQNANILQNLTVAENIFYNRMPYKNRFLRVIDQNLLDKMCMDIIKDLDLPFSLDDVVSRLGMAQKQILGFCRAYVSDARVVILDEPSASLTDHDQIILHTIMERIKARGAGILYISHNLNEIRQFGSRVSILNKGSLAGTLDLEKHSDDDIIKLMSGAAIKNRYPRIRVKQGKDILNIKHLRVEPVLDDISFTLHKGEIIGITGLAGSGRTCLAHSLFGAAKIDQGSIAVNGKGVYISNPCDAIELFRQYLLFLFDY